MAKFQLGGHEVKQGTGGEAVNALDENKTLMVTNLTGDEPIKPNVVTGLKNITDVFAHYNPSVDVEYEDGEGAPIEENIAFKSVADFGKKGLIGKSDFLKDLEQKRSEYQKFMKMLKIKQMGNIIKDPEAKVAYIGALKAMIQELEDSGVK